MNRTPSIARHQRATSGQDARLMPWAGLEVGETTEVRVIHFQEPWVRAKGKQVKLVEPRNNDIALGQADEVIPLDNPVRRLRQFDGVTRMEADIEHGQF